MYELGAINELETFVADGTGVGADEKVGLAPGPPLQRVPAAPDTPEET